MAFVSRTLAAAVMSQTVDILTCGFVSSFRSSCGPTVKKPPFVPLRVRCRAGRVFEAEASESLQAPAARIFACTVPLARSVLRGRGGMEARPRSTYKCLQVEGVNNARQAARNLQVPTGRWTLPT